MNSALASSSAPPIKFGTDGWRGVIAADFTFARVAQVAPLAAQVLAQNYGEQNSATGHVNSWESAQHLVIVGYDRRFLSEHFAQVAAEAIHHAGFAVQLSQSYAPTPLFSWVAKHQSAVGAIVITASHNPGIYSGLKVKGAFGGSVPPEVTRQIEAKLGNMVEQPALSYHPHATTLPTFDPWASGFLEDLRQKVDLSRIQQKMASGALTVFADVMHGAAATGLERLLGMPIYELNGDRDPLFEDGAPEPLPRYLQRLITAIQEHRRRGGGLAVGLVFDGDSDRIAAVDGQGNFLSSQCLIPILLEHLVTHHRLSGELVKTVSGSDLFAKVAALYQMPVFETAVGYKYIADRMLETKVLLGGEESGGIGYGHHIPERDALLSALYLLEAIACTDQDLGALYQNLQHKTGFASAYDRIDLPLANMEVRQRLLSQLQESPPEAIAGQTIVDCNRVDGYKFRLADDRWLMIRFSGTEPILRLYCEAATPEDVQQTLVWAKGWATAG